MLVNTVGEGGSQDRREVPVERRPLRRRVAEEGEIAAAIVADREHVVDAQPTVAGAIVVLDPCAVVRVIRILMTAPLEVGGERECRERRAGCIGVRQTRLPTVGPGEPTEQVVEGPVLHHREHDVLDAGRVGRTAESAGGLRERRQERAVGTAEGEGAGGRGPGREKRAA